MAGALWSPAIFIYHRGYMFRFHTLLSPPLLMIIAVAGSAAQSVNKPVADGSSAGRNAAALAENGRCTEALPQLRKSLAQLKDNYKDLRRKVSLNGLRCAMTLRRADTALDFLQVLAREFPGDPDVLYVMIHAYSDLSSSASQQLARSAPASYQAHELLAESFESQGKWDEAEKEYRAILKQNPNLPGIHFRLGRMLLSKPSPASTVANEAKQEFAQELEIDPNNAGADYVLGELARQDQQWDEAVNHFSHAAKLDPRFGEAFLGLGMALIAEKRYSDAVAPLAAAVKLEPKNPDAHYNLAMAYTRTGRKQEGEKEFAIHRSLIGNEGGPAQQTPSAGPPR
jgi:tetratricopeptide (TPR) repeat protein